MFSHIPFDCVLLLLLLLVPSSLEEVYTAQVGQDVVLPCHYSASSSMNEVPVCWGQGPCPVSQCHQTVLTTDGSRVNHQTSRRYKLKGYIKKGDVSLTIEKVTLTDSGIYCCRVQFPGLWNDQKVNLELVITPVEITTAQTSWKDFTTTFPQMLTTKYHDSAEETQTWEILHPGNKTQNFTSSTGLEDYMEGTRRTVYIAIGFSAGLVFFFIIATSVLKWYTYKKEKEQNSSLISMTTTPPSGLANAAAAGMRSEENIYNIEENVYELEDSNEYYCSIRDWQQP